MPGKVRWRSFSICCAKSSIAVLKDSSPVAAGACRTFQALSNQNVWQHKDLLVVHGFSPVLLLQV